MTSRVQIPKPPKRSLTAFFIYKDKVFDEVRDKNPAAKITEVTQVIAKMWAALPHLEREKYENEAQIRKKRYQKELNEYESIYGKAKRNRRKKDSQTSDTSEHETLSSIVKPSVPPSSTYGVEIQDTKWQATFTANSIVVKIMAPGFAEAKTKELTISDFF